MEVVLLPEVPPEMPGVVLRLNAPPTPASRTACHMEMKPIIPTEPQYYYIGVRNKC